jgi:hypothetical protein
MIITEEILLLQKRAGIITETEFIKKATKLKEAEALDPEAEENADQGLDAGLAALKSGIDSIKPSPKDKELKEIEPISLTAGVIASAPGLVTLLGKAVNFISNPFLKDKQKGTIVGNALKHYGEEMEDAYLRIIADGLKIAFPQTFGDIEYQKNNELGKAAKKTYMAILVAAGVSAGMSAANAHSTIVAGIEGGMAALKAGEAAELAATLSKAV